MLNLKDVTGVESSPISKSILENSLGNSILKDSRAYANYEFLLSSIQNGSFKAPSVIFASGDGTFYPKNTAYQGDFYSANILARDGYTNSWMTSYGTDENFNLSYYDGSKLFKSLSIDPATGKGKIRSLEVRNGNLPGQAGFVQFLLGFNESASTNDNGKYRHNFRTRHSTTSNSENAIDIFLWDYVNDSANAVGSRRVFSLYGTGSVEIVSGTQIFGPVSIAITTTGEKVIEQSTLAQTGKGVIYYNQSENKFRYSENGGLFKYLGGGSGGEDLNYVADASIVHSGSAIANTVYFQNPAIGDPPGSPTYRMPVGEPYYTYDGGSYTEITDPSTIVYDVDGYITSPLYSGVSAVYDLYNERIDQKVIQTEVYYSYADPAVLCNEPIKDSSGIPFIPYYNDPNDPNLITNEIYDYFGTRVGSRAVSDINEDEVVAIHVAFAVTDDWVDGDIKQFYFRSLMKPIMLNASTYYGSGLTFNKGPGILILTAETDERAGFIYLQSYLDNHVVDSESSISKDSRAYIIRVELQRSGTKIKIVSCEYRVPYYYEDTVLEQYEQGELTFRVPTWDKHVSDDTVYLRIPSSSSLDIFDSIADEAYSKITLTIGADWVPSLTGATPCWGFNNLFQTDNSGNSKIQLAIKTCSNITEATVDNN
jgi:hypothetical protein